MGQNSTLFSLASKPSQPFQLLQAFFFPYFTLKQHMTLRTAPSCIGLCPSLLPCCFPSGSSAPLNVPFTRSTHDLDTPKAIVCSSLRSNEYFEHCPSSQFFSLIFINHTFGFLFPTCTSMFFCQYSAIQFSFLLFLFLYIILTVFGRLSLLFMAPLTVCLCRSQQILYF